MELFQGTTVVAVKKDSSVAIAGDGQVTLGNNTIIKQGARKVRRLYNDNILAGFAGSVADALTLFEKFEEKLETYQGNILRSAVELAQEWRTDRALRRLEALLLAADRDSLLIISGNGEVIEPDDGIAAVGSGSTYAYAAAKALVQNTGLTATEIARESLLIASQICVYTNDRIVIEELK